METLIKYPSILNWIEPRFSLEILKKIQITENFDEHQLSLYKKEYSKKELHQFLKLINTNIKRGFKILCPTNPDFPYNLKFVFQCPTPLMYKGSLNLKKNVLSVVGSRRISQSTKDWMNEELYNYLKLDNDIIVASGGAYGVDQLAHNISLLTQTPTLCVLPAGINNLYPKNIKSLCQKIINENGTVLTPFPPDYPVLKSNFYFRNRILVLLSKCVFVVEARRRSGTMMTASLAAEYGVDLVTLPQVPLGPFMGNIDLMSSGCSIIRNKEDLSSRGF